MLLAPKLAQGDRIVFSNGILVSDKGVSSVGLVDGQFKLIHFDPSHDEDAVMSGNEYASHKEGPRSLCFIDPANALSTQRLGEGIWSTGVSADGCVALTSMTDGTVVAWDLVRRTQIARILDNPIKFQVRSIALSADGQFAATVGPDDKTLHFWKIPIPPPAGQLKTFDLGAEVHSVAVSPDGILVAAGTPMGVRHWPINGSFQQEEDIKLGHPVTSLTFTHTGGEIIYGTGQPRSNNNVLGMGAVDQYGRRGANTSLGSRRFEGHTDQITAAEVLEYGKRVISSSRDKTIRIWSMETGLEEHQIQLDVPINDLAVSPDRSRFLVAADDGTIRVYEVDGWKEISRLTGHSFLVLDVDWSPEGSNFVSASADRTIRVWNAKTLECTATLSGHTDRVNSAVILNFGRYVVSGSDDRTVRYWDADTAKQIAVFRGHQAPVTAVDVDGYGSRAVSSSLDKTVRIWDLTSKAAAIENGGQDGKGKP